MITVTPTRGDRKQLLDNCINQMSRQTERVKAMIIVDYKPKGKDKDITDRVNIGVSQSKGDMIAIIEDDDYYPQNYIEVVKSGLETHDVVGFDFSYYYHIKTRRWQRFNHQGRSSLFCTSFRPYALDGFKWPKGNYVFLDIEMWRHFNMSNLRIKWISDDECRPIGIKHGIGLTGGKGHSHSKSFKQSDSDLMWLHDNMDKESFKFYTSL